MRARELILVTAFVCAACAGDDGATGALEQGDLEPAIPAGQLPRALDMPDSLLLRLGDGRDVWWTLARESSDTAGAACVERGLEIRRDITQVAVPLLYSADVPEIVDDTTIQLRLWTDCVPGRLYHVNVVTGQPTPAPPAGTAGE